MNSTSLHADSCHDKFLFCPCGGKQSLTEINGGLLVECTQGCGIRPLVANSWPEARDLWNEAVLSWNPHGSHASSARNRPLQRAAHEG